jgi:hypothetical protein
LIRRNEKENQEIKDLRTKLNSAQIQFDSLQTEYRIKEQSHAKDTLRFLLRIKENEIKLQKTKIHYHEKISSIDNISADSAYQYLSDRY